MQLLEVHQKLCREAEEAKAKWEDALRRRVPHDEYTPILNAYVAADTRHNEFLRHVNEWQEGTWKLPE